MSFLAPLFLAGALTIAVPILLHLLKREPDARLKFSAVKMLRQAPVEHTRRRRLNELLLLLLRVTALLLLAIAFARPFFGGEAALASSGVTVVALDTSLSLAAPGQFERARELARRAVERAPSGNRVGVLTFADTPNAVAAPSADRALAIAAIDAASPGFGGTRYGSALDAAVDMLEGRTGTIVVVTDMQSSGWTARDRAAIPESARLEIADVGPPPPNLAVIAARAAGDRVIAAVRNAGGQTRDARVQLTIDGRAAGQAAATIEPGQTAEVVLPAGRGRDAVVTVEDRDGVQGDNSRYLVLDTAARPAVLVMTGGGDLERDAFYLGHALTAAGADGAAFDVEAVAGAQLQTWDGARLNRYAAVILASTRGLERRGRDLLAEYIRGGGGGVLVAAGPDVDAEVAAGAVGGALSLVMPVRTDRPRERTLAPADARHPIFQAFQGAAATLALVKFQRVATIRGANCRTLARFTSSEPALVECDLGAGRVLALASDLDNAWNDFPVHPTFVPFIHEAIRYLSGARPHAGEYLVGDAPAGVAPRPGIAAVKGTGVFSGRVSAENTPVPFLRVAVNVDPAETDSTRLTPEQFLTAITKQPGAARSAERLEAREQEERQHLWQYVLGLMVAMLALESVIGSRTS
jgi:hypothetical protein